MKLLMAGLLLVATNAFANPVGMPSWDQEAMSAATNQALENYARDVVGMTGAIKLHHKNELLVTTTTVTEMSSGCSFQAYVVLKNWGWSVKEKAHTNTCF